MPVTSHAAEDGSRPVSRGTFFCFATGSPAESKYPKKRRADHLRPCASLRQTAASQFTMQRCPAAALPAARTACRRRRHTGGFRRPERVVTKSTSNAYPQAIAAIKKTLYRPCAHAARRRSRRDGAAGLCSLLTFLGAAFRHKQESKAAGGPRPAL